MNSGVSIEMIAELCRSIKRNMYAFDADQKLIHSVTSATSEHYCPIVYYKVHGHCYLIDDPTIFRSVAESNKRKGVSIVTTTVKDTEEVEGATVYQTDKFDVEKVGEYAEGIYLVQSDNFGTENLQYINRYGRIPYTKTTKSSITEIKFFKKGKTGNFEFRDDLTKKGKTSKFEFGDDLTNKNGIELFGTYEFI